MSNDNLHKRRNDERQRRKTDIKNQRKGTWLIVTEGEKTEPNYFEEAIKDFNNGLNEDDKITAIPIILSSTFNNIKIDITIHTTPKFPITVMIGIILSNVLFLHFSFMYFKPLLSIALKNLIICALLTFILHL